MSKGKNLIERLPLWRDRPFLTAALTLALVAVSLGVRMAVDTVLPSGFPFVTFFPAVILSGFFFGIRNGVIAAVLCGIGAWWFFIAPASGYALTGGSIAAMLLYAFVVATELAVIGWMQSAHRALVAERGRCESLAASRELMFNELQHRVSNNLQMAASLISLQGRRVRDPEALAALDEASRRLSVIGRISRALYDPDGAALGLDEMLSRLCADVIDASGRSDVTIAVTADGAATVNPDAAIPVALIVAEAVSNAIEHGFAGGRGGRIDVRVAQNDNRLEVSVTDNGHGLPEGFDLASSESLGLRIAGMLAKQLGGEFSLNGGSATRAQLTLAP